MHAIIASIIKYRKLVLALTLLCTVALVSQVRNLQIVIDPAAMLPKDHPNVLGTQIAERLFGNKYVVVVGVSAVDGASVLRPEILEAVQNLTRKISAVNGVRRHTVMSILAPKAKAIEGSDGTLSVESLISAPFTPVKIEKLRQNIASNPIYQNTLISADETLASISFSVEVSQSGFRKAVDQVEALTKDTASATVRTTLSGTPVFFATVERFSQRMGFLFPIALLLIGLLHFEAFRSIQGMVLPLVTAVLAVLWVLGIMGAVHMPLDAFNATTPILILAVAAGHAVQILKRYYEEYETLTKQNPNQDAAERNREAVQISLSKMAPVMITAGLVAALGFFSLITFEISTIRTFGVITGLGIVCALVLELTFIPALRSMLRPPAARTSTVKNTTTASKPQIWDRLADRLLVLIIARPKVVLISFATFALISGTGLLFLNQENSTKSYFADRLEVRQQDRLLNEKLAGTNTLYVVFQGNKPDVMKQPEVLRKIEATQRYIETLPDVGKTVSIVDLLKRMNQAMKGGSSANSVLPDSADLASQYLLLYSMSGEPTDFDAYIDYEYRNANLVVWTRNDSSKYAHMIVAKIRDFAERDLPPGITIQVGGSVPQTSALSATLVRGKLLNIVQMIAVVFLAGALVFRSLLAALYLIVPLLVTVLANFGLMGITGIPLNTPNSVSSAMAIGIGADYSIYLMFRVREALQRHGDLEMALRETLLTAGKAVMYVAVAVSIGYAVLMLSFGFYVHVWLGALIACSMLVSAITALVLVPTLVLLKPPRFLKGDGLRPTPLVAPKVLGSSLSVIVLAGLGLVISLGFLNVSHAAPTASEVMERSYSSTRLDSSISNATFKLTSASGQERVRNTFGVTKQSGADQNTRRMIRFLTPSDVRNTTSLIVENAKGEDEIWVYLPALKKARRVAGGNKKGSFMGTDLSYADVLGYRPELWRHRLLKEELFNNVNTWVIESIPVDETVANDSGYNKRISWISKDNFVAIQVQAYDLGGALLKTTLNTQLKAVDSARTKWQAMQIDVLNHQSGHQTKLVLDRFQANVAVSDDYFSMRYLEKEE